LSTDGVAGMLFTGRGPFRARLTQIELERLRLAVVEEARSHGSLLSWFPRAGSWSRFLSTADQRRCGPEIEPRAGNLVTFGSGERFHSMTAGPCHWGTIQMPARQIADYGRAVRGTRLVLPPAVRWRPPRARSGMVHTETSPLSLRVVWIAQACFSGLVKDELLGHALQHKGLAGSAGSVDHDFIAESPRRQPPLGRKRNRGREIASGSRPRP
jgi:hypothetical protein